MKTPRCTEPEITHLMMSALLNQPPPWGNSRCKGKQHTCPRGQISDRHWRTERKSGSLKSCRLISEVGSLYVKSRLTGASAGEAACFPNFNFVAACDQTEPPVSSLLGIDRLRRSIGGWTSSGFASNAISCSGGVINQQVPGKSFLMMVHLMRGYSSLTGDYINPTVSFTGEKEPMVSS